MKTNKFISPFISCVVQNFPFIEESIDGLTQYELLCKIVEKLNVVITQTNTQTENIEKLEEAFTTLKNYVDNYFNNLDVQTEINNKLDEMATSGELEAIIASYLNTQAVRGFSTLNDLKNATGLITGAICQTSGKTTYKDGFGSLYRIRNITNEDVVDNDNLVAITSDVSLVAEKITNNISNTKTTGTTNTYSCDYINNAIDNSKLKSAILVILNEPTEVTITEGWEQSKIPFNKVLRKLGDGFSLSNNGTVVASNDIKRFKAVVGVRMMENYSDDIYPRILSEMGASWFSESGYQASSTQLKNEIIGTCINNKNIYATITSSQAGTVKLRGDNQYTYMLVEEL